MTPAIPTDIIRLSMQRLAANPIRQVVAFLLVAGLSICCCQAHFLLLGFSDAEASVAAPAHVASACCTGCADEEPAGSPEQDSGPEDGCQVCCIKGTGLKDDGRTSGETCVLAPIATLPVTVAATTPDSGLRRPHDLDARLRADAPTLVRLRCALLI